MKFSNLLVTLNSIFLFKAFFKGSVLGYKIVKINEIWLFHLWSPNLAASFYCVIIIAKETKDKLQNNIFGYKRVIYFDARNQNCMLFDLYLCLKSFLAIKSGRQSYLICFCFFVIRDLQIVGSYICYVYLIPFGYKKGVQHHTRHDFLSATPTLELWVVSFAMFDSWPFYQAKSWKT